MLLHLRLQRLLQRVHRGRPLPRHLLARHLTSHLLTSHLPRHLAQPRHLAMPRNLPQRLGGRRGGVRRRCGRRVCLKEPEGRGRGGM